MTDTVSSPLAELHRNVGAETLAYDTTEIVSTFGEPQAEYAAIRKAAGLLDLPQRGLIELTGDDRHAFLNNLISNQLVDKATKTPLQPGQWVYAFLLNLKGRVVLDLNVIETGGRTLLELDGRLVPMLVSLLDRYVFAERVKIRSLAGEAYEIALHGPGAADLLTAEGMTLKLSPGQCGEGTLGGAPIIVWRDDPCGVPGLHLIVPNDRAADLWQHLLARHGNEISLGKRSLRPIGWAAFNATRVEAGRLLFGVDFELAPPSMPGKQATAQADAEPRPVGVLPAETTLLDRAVSFTKGCYLGQEVVARMHARSQVARQLVGLRVDDDALPIAGAQVFDDQQNVVGVVTSSTMSPILSDAAIALAMVRKPMFDVGRRLLVAAEGAVRGAVVTPLPFLQKGDE
jgi:folate-binding protein YgfZ